MPGNRQKLPVVAVHGIQSAAAQKPSAAGTDGTDEQRRLEQLSCYAITAQRGDSSLDSITNIAVRAVNGDIGGISLIFQSEIWLPARVGIDVTSVPRAGSFCTCAIQSGSDEVFEIEDARCDPRFESNSLVAAPYEFLHYAAAPLRSNRGYFLGTLWMMKHAPGRLSAEQSSLFRGMAKLVVETLELRHTNEVTGMPNRAVFMHQVQAAIARQEAPHLLVGYIDLIAFRQINDALGWTAGNEILRLIASRLNDWVGAQHHAAHLGADKFAFALFGSDCDFSQRLEGLKRVLHQALVLITSGPKLLQARVGIVQEVLGGKLLATELLDAAETAAAAIGNHVQTTTVREYGADLRMRSRAIGEMQAMLDGDRQHGALLAYYQPQVDFEKGELIGLEALARWDHPQRGLIQPGHFIELAERSGKIYQLDSAILDQVCRDLRTWMDAGLVPVPVSFNYSRSSLLYHDVIGDFHRVLQRHRIPGHLLELEITETQLLENLASISRRVDQFRELGVRIAVDDFGTGYSNLDAIHNFPFDRLKVDRQFVNGVARDERTAGLFHLIHGIADLFKAELLCEGLERIEDLQWLQHRNACCVQGWYFSAARPSLEIAGILTSLRKPSPSGARRSIEGLRQALH